MKKILLSIFAISALTACETIDEGERWTEPAPVEMKKNVLVEDFTGQNCVNCPNAADLLHELLATTMGEHIVAVGVHGGALSLNVNKTAMGLATDQGDEYNTHWGVQSWPAGMVDRTDGNGNVGRTCDFTSWSSAIVAQLQKDLLADIDLTATYDAESRNLNINGKVSATEEGNVNISDLAVTVWLTESNITGMQMMPDASRNMQYVHNHVLRDVISAPYGDALRDGSFSYSHTIPTNYGKATAARYEVKPENMAVVAFVTNKSGEVLQVVDVPVVK